MGSRVFGGFPVFQQAFFFLFRRVFSFFYLHVVEPLQAASCARCHPRTASSRARTPRPRFLRCLPRLRVLATNPAVCTAVLTPVRYSNDLGRLAPQNLSTHCPQYHLLNLHGPLHGCGRISLHLNPPQMFDYPQPAYWTGHFTCYKHRTDHLLTTKFQILPCCLSCRVIQEILVVI